MGSNPVPLFPSPTKALGRGFPAAVLGGGLGQPLTPDTFARMPGLLTANSDDEESPADAIIWRAEQRMDLLGKMCAADDRPNWHGQQPASSIQTYGKLECEIQAAGRLDSAASTTATGPDVLAADISHAKTAPWGAFGDLSAGPTDKQADMLWDILHGNPKAVTCVPESTVAKQAVLALQVRRCLERIDEVALAF